MIAFKPIYLAPALLFQLSACVNTPTVSEIATSPEALAAAYQHSLDEAKYPSVSKIANNLVALVPTTEKLVFNEQGQVLMTTFTKAQYFSSYTQGQDFKLYGETWFTAAPFVQEFCQNYSGDNLLLRTQQLLGLPPKTENPNNSVASFWVNPADIYRPCADPEVTDSECVVTLSGDIFVDGHTSWPQATQVSQDFVSVTSTHLDWMASNWDARYSPEKLYDRYPWTALGYTYDWAIPGSSVGMSEFVSNGGTAVTFESIETLDAYCGR